MMSICEIDVLLPYEFHTVHVVIESNEQTPINSGTCSKCGTIKKSGQRSCCAPGGAWVKKCGNPGDSKFEHTWPEGIEACKGKCMMMSICDIAVLLAYEFHTVDVPVESNKQTPIDSGTCSKCGTIKKTGQRSCCAPGGTWAKKCGSPGNSKFDHTWFEGIEACKGNSLLLVSRDSHDKNHGSTAPCVGYEHLL